MIGLQEKPLMERRPALGKGLSALIPETPEVPRNGLLQVDIDLLAASEQQPRLQMDDAKLEELAHSIRANGVIQPILVRRTGNTYRIIAGERRWRAAQRAGLLKVPVVVREVPEGSEQQLLELALIENIQRENLSPVDEALAYQRLAGEFALTQDQIAAAVGKDRSSIANYVRLLKLPEEVRADLACGTISMGHARALLALPDAAAQRHAAREVIARGLSVRDTEALVKRLTNSHAPPTRERNLEPGARNAESAKDVHTRAAEDRMRFALGTKVRIVRRGNGGTVEVDFVSEAELNRIYEFITTKH
jgi:ParB family chromosome partitioning protein